jgi:putative ABC transport system substrate-binding protein
LTVLRDGLAESGYIEGRAFKLEARRARGNPEVLPQLVRELIQLRVDVVVATACASIEAARAATKHIPIIANDLENDPIASSHAVSLSHPRGNLTGAVPGCADIMRKMVAVAHAIVPGLTRIGVLALCDGPARLTGSWGLTVGKSFQLTRGHI